LEQLLFFFKKLNFKIIRLMVKAARFYALLALLFTASITWAQSTLKGSVKDATGGLPGVSIAIKGTTTGTITDGDGNYTLKLPNGTHDIVFSFIGFTPVTKSVTVNNSEVTLDVVLSAGDNSLTEVVISTGSRNTQRTVTDSPLPIDILNTNDLRSTGQQSFDKALQYRVPSFNSVNTPVNDATTLLDPYEIRNMGPSRTLILINGKRKNLSSLLYVQFSPGRGETGVDLSAIPSDAIKRVEILRDGASAQYGSDAIAGVMNVILKDKYEYSSLNFNAGVTGKGDGANYGVSLNSGSNLGDKGGYLNYTIALSQSDNAVRSGNIHVPTEIETFGNPYGKFKGDNALKNFRETSGVLYDGTKINPLGVGATQANLDAWNANTALHADNNAKYNTIITNYLKDYPTGNNLNGTGEITSAKFVVNGGLPFGEKGMFYTNAAYVTKRVLSNANFRTPYWRQDRGLLHNVADNGGKNYLTSTSQLAFASDGLDMYKGYKGYMPSFEGDLADYNMSIGAKNETDGWKHDLSFTLGGNTQSYTVDNTVNRGLGLASPTRFKPGGYGFHHLVGNIDVSKAISPEFGIAFGAEARSETYTIVAGDEASYTSEYSNSFPGINPLNAGSNSRFNLGGYMDLSYDITKEFMVNGTFRTEKYSDFGAANVWKLSTRYKLPNDIAIIRGSVSTGFRAPTLHQIYAQSIQASFSGGVINLSGLFNNRSAQARALQIPNLKPEQSTNVTLGVALNPMKNMSISLDYYNITVKDRIVYSSSISSDNASTDLYKILNSGGLSSVQFFINGITTITTGLDVVANYRNIALGDGKMAVNLAANFVLGNKIDGDPTTPKPISDAGSGILNAQIKSLLTESRPAYKAILGVDYTMGAWNFNLNNTLFGKTGFRDLDNGGSAMLDIKAEFSPAVVTDLGIGYAISKKVGVGININNIFNILPKWDLIQSTVEPSSDPVKQAKRVTDANATLNNADAKALLRGFLGFSGRYDILGYNGSQFSQLGTIFNANLNIKF
jgi:iron complex outermembrane recepter protein